MLCFSTGKDVIKITYQDKIRLTALWKQASAGKYDPSKIPEVGYFDVVGNDRKYAHIFLTIGSEKVFIENIIQKFIN